MIIPFFSNKFFSIISFISFPTSIFLKGGSQKIKLNFDSQISLFSISWKTLPDNILVLLLRFNLLIFFFRILIASPEFSTKQTLPATLERHSKPKDTVTDY